MKDGFYIKPNGVQEWWLNGQRHREDGPAIITPSGNFAWYLRGIRHRSDGPAIIWGNGAKEWLLNGMRHREDGPAILYPCGEEWWFFNDVNITPKVLEWLKQLDLPPWQQWDDTEKTLFRMSF